MDYSPRVEESRTRVGQLPFLSFSFCACPLTLPLRACTSTPVSALLSQALFARSHPRTLPSPLQNLGPMCWGLLLESASSWPSDTPTPDPTVLQPHPEVAGARPALACLHHPGRGQCDDLWGYFVEPCIVGDQGSPGPHHEGGDGAEGRGGGSVSGCFPGRHPVSQLRTAQPPPGLACPRRAEPGPALRPPDPRSLTLLAGLTSQHCLLKALEAPTALSASNICSLQCGPGN